MGSSLHHAAGIANAAHRNDCGRRAAAGRGLRPRAARIVGVIIVAVIAAAAGSAAADRVTLVQTDDPAFVNRQIGTLLDDTSSVNGKPHFPSNQDPSIDFGPDEAPDLSAASGVLGGWLNQPPDLSAPGWEFIASPTINWVVNTEIALVYQFNVQSVTDLRASIGVDNGVYVYLNGSFVVGALRGGPVAAGEHVYELGDLQAGANYIQFILEDHGSTNGFELLIDAESVVVPEPATAALGIVAAALVLSSRTRRAGSCGRSSHPSAS
jgi:hypothetical protein